MRSPKRLAGLLVLILAAITAVATTPPPPSPLVPVSLTEWSVTALGTVESGEVRFDVQNDGGAVHQLAIYRGGSLRGDSIDGGTLIARTGNIRPGETETLQTSLEPGDYWLVCPITGHTVAGMSAQLSVDESASPVVPRTTPALDPPDPGRSSGLFVVIGVLALLVAAGGAAAFFVLRRRGVGV